MKCQEDNFQTDISNGLAIIMLAGAINHNGWSKMKKKNRKLFKKKFRRETEKEIEKELEEWHT